MMKKYFFNSLLIMVLVFSFINPPLISFAQTTPVITTSNPTATSITSNSVTLGCVVSTSDDISDYNISFQYIIDEYYQLTNFNEQASIESIPISSSTGTTDKTVSASITNLAANTTYHFRLKMEGLDNVITYSNEATFTTLATLNSSSSGYVSSSSGYIVFAPKAVTEPAINATFNSIILKGVLNPSGYNATAYFQYATDAQFGTSADYPSQALTHKITAGGSKKDINLTESIIYLEPSTTYHFRIKMISEDPSKTVTTGSDQTFTTLAVTTITPSTTSTTPTTVTPSTTTPTTSTTELIPCGTTTNSTPCNEIDTTTGLSKGWGFLMALINNVVNFILFRLVIPIAAVMFAYAGFELLTSGGEVSKRDKAKKIFINVAIGLIIAAAAWLIVNTILTTLGYDGAWIGFK